MTLKTEVATARFTAHSLRVKFSQLTLLVLWNAIQFAMANPIVLPSEELTVPSINASGTSFTYNGILTQADTLSFTEAGVPCLQSSAYCMNGAGVILVDGMNGPTQVVGNVITVNATFNGKNANWDYGAIVLEISSVGSVQIFAADASVGLGSSNPPSALTLATTSLSALGFGNFLLVNPTLTFVIADGPGEYSDNTGSFFLTQSSANAVPEPKSCFFALVAAICGKLIHRRLRRSSWVEIERACN